MIGVIIALIGVCVSVSLFDKTGSRSMASLAVFFLFLHIGFFSCTSDATSYIYSSEIFPTSLRAKGLAVSVSGLFVATIIFLQAAATAFDVIGWKYYTVFIACSTCTAIFVAVVCPEVRRTTVSSLGLLRHPTCSCTNLSFPRADKTKVS